MRLASIGWAYVLCHVCERLSCHALEKVELSQLPMQKVLLRRGWVVALHDTNDITSAVQETVNTRANSTFITAQWA